MKATATRLPSLASNVLKLKEEVLNPKPDANGWCLGRESVEKALEEMRNGRPVVVTDDGGPNPLMGFTIVEAESMDAALEIAKACPHLEIGTIELAEVKQM